MAFFERLGKRITDTSQEVAQKTKDLTGVIRLSNTISEKEKQILQLYQELGQAYFEGHRNDSDSDSDSNVQPIIDQLNQLHKEIIMAQEEIKQLKGVQKCPACGVEIPLHATFCNACGAKIISEPESIPEGVAAARVCPVCGSPAKANSLFCTHCGAKLDEVEKEATELEV